LDGVKGKKKTTLPGIFYICWPPIVNRVNKSRKKRNACGMW